MTTRPTVFIDGQAGTTGLRIRELLAGRDDQIEVLEIAAAHRKDERARRELLNGADLSILCLPDDAARTAVALVSNPRARIIDASTAHRVSPEFVFGLPELSREQRPAIAAATRVSNPGCYSTCVVLLLRPLIDAGLLRADAPLSIHALSGYSGGGHTMIDRWERTGPNLLSLPYEAPYALGRRHKHIPEMMRYARLAAEPYFVPAVGPFRCGMRVQIPLHATLLATGTGPGAVWEALHARYSEEQLIDVRPWVAPDVEQDEAALDPRACNGTNRAMLHVIAHPGGHLLLVAILDNLAKGASGAAVQNMNLMLGLPEYR
jgi:N-acetyl-gamma-glutamyl-phosphate reductase